MKFSQFALLFAFAFFFAFSKAASVAMENNNLDRRTSVENAEQEKVINTFNKRSMNEENPTKSSKLVTRTESKRDPQAQPSVGH